MNVHIKKKNRLYLPKERSEKRKEAEQASFLQTDMEYESPPYLKESNKEDIFGNTSGVVILLFLLSAEPV